MALISPIILEADDGGIYRLSNPSDVAQRQWTSVNGDLRVTEVLSIAYDSLHDVISAGAQDNGIVEQVNPGDLNWVSFRGGDGSTQAVAVVDFRNNDVDDNRDEIPDDDDEIFALRFGMGNNFHDLNFRAIDKANKTVIDRNVHLARAPSADALSGLNKADRDFDGFDHSRG